MTTPLQSRLTTLRERWRELSSFDRERWEEQKECKHLRTALYAWRAADGQIQLWEGCATCHAKLTNGFLPHEGVDVAAAEVVQDRRFNNPPCEVCGQFGTQLHHWAPRGVFGFDEATHWPTSYLCVPCHSDWHRRMGATE